MPVLCMRVCMRVSIISACPSPSTVQLKPDPNEGTPLIDFNISHQVSKVIERLRSVDEATRAMYGNLVIYPPLV